MFGAPPAFPPPDGDVTAGKLYEPPPPCIPTDDFVPDLPEPPFPPSAVSVENELDLPFAP